MMINQKEVKTNPRRILRNQKRRATTTRVPQSFLGTSLPTLMILEIAAMMMITATMMEEEEAAEEETEKETKAKAEKIVETEVKARQRQIDIMQFPLLLATAYETLNASPAPRVSCAAAHM